MARLVLVDADELESLNDFASEAFDTLCDMPTCIEDMVDAEFPGALAPRRARVAGGVALEG